MAQYTHQIQTLYTAYFGRPADVDGLNYWEKYLSVTGSTAAVADVFAESAEYKSHFSGQSPSNIINDIYVQLFGHAADLPGLTYWTAGLANGNFTIANAVTTIAAGALKSDFTAIVSKVAGATLWTAALDTPEEILAYSGGAANARAHEFMASITDPATLATAMAQLDVVIENLHIRGAAPVDEFAITLVGQASGMPL